MRYGSLFTGVGGFDLGFDRAGMTCAWQVERDAQCRTVLERHWPGVERYEDVRNVGAELAAVDLICGGFPCQDLSVAGRRAGLAGERSGLWHEFHRIVTELTPQWVVIENVPGLLSSNGGRDFAVILRGLVECGYGVAWRVLDSQYFGVAQRRRRVFIVASLGSGAAAQVLFESESLPGNPAPGREARPELARDIAASLKHGGGNGRGFNLDFEAGLVAYVGNNTSGPIPVDTAVNAHSSRRYDFESETFVTSALMGGHGRGYRIGADEAAAGHILAFTERGRAGGRNLETQQDVAYALTNPGAGGRTHSRQIAVAFGVRRLTPLECERLQGFPDCWTDGQSDAARYRQMGNAVTVPVIEWLGRRIMAAVEVGQ